MPKLFSDGQKERASQARSRQKQPLTYYRSAGKTDPSPFQKKAAKKMQRRRLSNALDILIILLAAILIIYILIIRPNPKVGLNSTTYHSSGTYQTAVYSQFKYIKNRNKITLDEKSIATSLKKQFPEISSVNVNLSVLGQTATVNIKVSEPSFVLNSKGSDYIVDADGVATGVNSNYPSIKGLPVVIDQTGYTAVSGRQILSASEVGFINNLIAQSRRAKVPIASLNLPAKAQELDLRTTDRTYYVKFYLGGDPLVEAGQFLAARQKFDQTSSQPAEYLDVRVSGKIYYK